MFENKKMKMNLAIYSILSIAVLITFFYIRVVLAKGNPIDFVWGAVFGLAIAIIINSLKGYYEKMNREAKIKQI